MHGLGIAHQMPSFPLVVPGGTPTLKGGLQRAVQHSAGLEYAMTSTIQTTVTAFQHLFFQFTDARSLPVSYQELVRSDGRAYGIETLLRKHFSERWSGLFSYTLSRSERSREIYSGVAAWDRTHVFNGALSFAPDPSWRLGIRGIFYTGIPGTAPLRTSPLPRTTPFWRIDLRAEKAWFWQDQVSLRLVLEILNTTLNSEMLTLNCQNEGEPCREEFLGPVTVPNLGLVANF